jgi:hypothetical protein
MRLEKGTVEDLAANGYELRPTFYGYEIYHEKGFEYSYNYYSIESWREWNPTLSEGEIEVKRKERAKDFADNYYSKGRWFSESTELYVFKGYDIVCVIKNLPKYTETKKEYIRKRIEKAEKAYNSYYGGFCKKIQELLRKEQIEHGFWIYPTTYGIGVWVFFNFHASECINIVTNLLKKYNIEYYNEYSEAHYVYRFKISKKEANRLKLAA